MLRIQKGRQREPSYILSTKTYLLVDPLVHGRLPLLGPLDIEEPDEGLDGDPLEIRASDIYVYVYEHDRGTRSRPRS